MGSRDWYRNTTWDDAIAATFQERLARSRQGSRAEYLRIQINALAARYPSAALGLVALNPGLYRLLGARLGPAHAAACVPLHVLHHLTAAASVPLGAAYATAAAVRRSKSAPSTASPSSRYSASLLTDQTS